MNRTMANDSNVGFGDSQKAGDIRAGLLVVEGQHDNGAFALLQALHAAREPIRVQLRQKRFRSSDVLFEETTRTLLSSDFLGHTGDTPVVTESDIVGRFRDATLEFQGGPFAFYMPYTPHTENQVRELASLKPRVCAPMHGSTFIGDGSKALMDMAAAMKEVLGAPIPAPAFVGR